VEIVCPKCGERGRVRVIKQRKPQNIYRYVVIDHGHTKHVVNKEMMVDIIEKLLDENYELKTRIAKLEEEYGEMKEKVVRLETENMRLRPRAELYDEMVRHSVVIRYSNIEDLEKIKKMMEEKKIDMIRVVAYKTITELEYVDIK